MRKYPIHVSETGAGGAEFVMLPTGKPVINLSLPVGGGRRMQVQLAIGSARAAHQVLAAALADVAAELGDYDPDLAKGRR